MGAAALPHMAAFGGSGGIAGAVGTLSASVYLSVRTHRPDLCATCTWTQWPHPPPFSLAPPDSPQHTLTAPRAFHTLPGDTCDHPSRVCDARALVRAQATLDTQPHCRVAHLAQRQRPLSLPPHNLFRLRTSAFPAPRACVEATAAAVLGRWWCWGLCLTLPFGVPHVPRPSPATPCHRLHVTRYAGPTLAPSPRLSFAAS